MVLLFCYVIFGSLCVIIMYAMRKKYIGYMIILMMVMTVANHAMIWTHEQKVKWDKRMEGVNEKVDSINKSIDKLAETKDKIENNSVTKGVKKATNSIDKADKKIKDFGFGLREKITGKKTKRLEE